MEVKEHFADFHENKDDLIIIRIEKRIKNEFTDIIKEKKLKQSQMIRGWIKEYVNSHR